MILFFCIIVIGLGLTLALALLVTVWAINNPANQHEDDCGSGPWTGLEGAPPLDLKD